MAIALDKAYKALGYSSTFKDICKLKKEKELMISGYQLERYTGILQRLGVNYKVLDVGYGFKITV